MKNNKSGNNSGVIFIIVVAIAGLVLGGLAISTPSSSVTTKYDESIVNNNLKFPIGNENAKVKVVIFSDFLCPYCASLHEKIDEMLNSDPIKLVAYTRTFIIHDGAELMSKAAYAAGIQGKYKEASNSLFTNYQNNYTEEDMLNMAKELGLDIDKFKTDMNSDEAAKSIETDNNDAQTLGLGGTPSVFINGKYVDDLSQFETLVDEANK